MLNKIIQFLGELGDICRYWTQTGTYDAINAVSLKICRRQFWNLLEIRIWKPLISFFIPDLDLHLHIMLCTDVGQRLSYLLNKKNSFSHYSDVIMSAMVSQITGVSIVYLTVCSGTDQRKHQSTASLAFVRGTHRWPVNSSHKDPVTWTLFPLDYVIMVQPILVGVCMTVGVGLQFCRG